MGNSKVLDPICSSRIALRSIQATFWVNRSGAGFVQAGQQCYKRCSDERLRVAAL